jgi:hypothetical protein
MSTPIPAVQSPREVVILLLKVPKTEEPSGIKIIPYSFRVSKSEEEVIWFCPDPKAKFEVNFNFEGEGSPFTANKFTRESRRSGRVHENVQPGPKEFRYTVKIDGDTHNSPGGQVDL